MAYTNPLIPRVNIFSATPDSQLVVSGTFTGSTTGVTDVAGVYTPGCLLTAIDTGNVYRNAGTTASPSFDNIATISPSEIALTDGRIFVGNASNIAAAVAMSGDTTISNTGVVTIANSAVTTAKIADANVTLGKLASGVAPAYVAKYGGTFTWSGSGATAAATVTGVAATDLVMATVKTKATEASYLVAAVPTTNTITFELSAANTSNDAVIMYTVFRAAA